MRTLYIEDLASHGGPESCVGVPRGRSEALTGVRAGGVIEPRNETEAPGADVLVRAEGNTAGGVYRESLVDPARSESSCTYGVSMRENREIPWSPTGADRCLVLRVRGVVDRRRVGREGNAEAVIPR